MSTNFRLNADDLTSSFLENVRAMFAHRNIRISITDENEPPFASHKSHGVTGANLMQSLESLPKLSEDEVEAWLVDQAEIRRLANQPLPRKLWDM